MRTCYGYQVAVEAARETKFPDYHFFTCAPSEHYQQVTHFVPTKLSQQKLEIFAEALNSIRADS